MKILKTIFTLCLIFTLALFMCACNNSNVVPDNGDKPVTLQENNKVLISISVDEFPTVIYYGLNDKIQYQGIKIVGRYDDNTTALIPYTSCDFSIVDMTTYGKKTITVSYEEQESEFDIYVMHNVEIIPDTADEKTYLYQNEGSGIGSEGDRFADENSYFVYKFSCEQGLRFNEANISLTVRNEYVLAVSFDGINYTIIAEGATGADRIDFADLEIDLTENVNFAENTGELYFKFYDGVNSDGFGVSLKSFNIHYLTTDIL